MNRQASTTITMFVALLFAVLPGAALANAGEILFARGDVSVVGAEGVQRQGESGMELSEGDHILTGESSMAQLRLSDGALISLRSHSDYQIEVQNEEEGLLEQAGTLFKGWMRKVSGSISSRQPDKVSEKTPVATIGIRGTSFQVIHIPEGGLPGYDSEPGTYVYLEEGGIETTAGGRTRFLEAGQVVFIPADGGGPRPAPDKKSLFLNGGEGGERQAEEGETLEDVLAREENGSQRINDGVDDVFSMGMLSATGVFFDGTTGVQLRASEPNLSVHVKNGEWVVDRMEGSNGLTLQADSGAVPAGGFGGRSLADNTTHISWGIWESSQYTATDEVNGEIPEANRYDWHYMVANNSLTENDLTNMVNGGGLSGAFEYNYVGGTLAPHPTNTQATYTGGVSGMITVDFDAFAAGNGISMYVQLAAFHNFDGYGSIEEFYNGGFDISGVAPGWIEGQFVGEGAEGIISNIRLDEQTGGTYWGTAAFEQGNEVGGIPN